MSDNRKENPCDLCSREMDCFDCALGGYTAEYICCTSNCFLNYEGNCVLGLYVRCGAWKKHDRKEKI